MKTKIGFLHKKGLNGRYVRGKHTRDLRASLCRGFVEKKSFKRPRIAKHRKRPVQGLDCPMQVSQQDLCRALFALCRARMKACTGGLLPCAGVGRRPAQV